MVQEELMETFILSAYECINRIQIGFQRGRHSDICWALSDLRGAAHILGLRSLEARVMRCEQACSLPPSQTPLHHGILLCHGGDGGGSSGSDGGSSSGGGSSGDCSLPGAYIQRGVLAALRFEIQYLESGWAVYRFPRLRSLGPCTRMARRCSEGKVF
jgi:hypothetical protein